MGNTKSNAKVKKTSMGKAEIGGPFKLKDVNGNEFSEKNL